MERTAVIVVGHTCLDVIPSLKGGEQRLSQVLAPGQLRKVGPLVLATGGAVPNTGLALHRLGTPARLVGKVGDDFIGRAIVEIIQGYDPALADGMIVKAGADSSYTVILSSPGLDRTFLHYPGPNDTFRAEDVPDEVLQGGRILHFGYPPLMRQMYLNNGEELLTLLQRARDHGLVTSLDVSQPDPDSEAGRADWATILARILPYVDIYLPGVEETLLMLDPGRFARLSEEAGEASLLSRVDGGLLQDLAAQLLEFGAAVVGLKLGDQGLYLRTTSDHRRLSVVDEALPIQHRPWLNRELLAPAFKANLVGATGAGDCTVAGFLTAMVKGLAADVTLRAAVAVGAFNVEAADAVSGVPTWDVVWQRIDAGWDQIPTHLRLRGWGWEVDRQLWIGPGDRGGLIAQRDN